MFQCLLYEPEIPPNTGNIIRLCANTGIQLHLIHPLGFILDDKRLRRAGLDYHEWASVQEHQNLAECLAQPALQTQRVFACTTKAKQGHHIPAYRPGDAFLFGPETRGLPADVLAQFPPEQCIRIPMLAQSRSLNLSNSVAIILYEALRQQDFIDMQ